MDIKILADQLFEAFKTSVLAAIAGNAPDIKAAKDAYLLNSRVRLTQLSLNALNEDPAERLSYGFIITRLKEETITLKDALLGIEQMAASDTQALATNLINIFEGLLRAAILSLKPIQI